MTSQVRTLVEIAEDMNKFNINVFQRSKPNFTSQDAHSYQQYLLEVGSRFKQILNLIQSHAQETLQDASLGMEEVEHDKYEDGVIWSGIEFMTNNDKDYFNTKIDDCFDIPDLAHLFPEHTVPEDVNKAFLEMIAFTDIIGIPNGNAKVVANKDGVFITYTPVIAEPVSMSLSR